VSESTGFFAHVFRDGCPQGRRPEDTRRRKRWQRHCRALRGDCPDPGHRARRPDPRARQRRTL